MNPAISRRTPVRGRTTLLLTAALCLLCAGFADSASASKPAFLRVVTGDGKSLVSAKVYTGSTSIPTSPKADCFGPPGGSGKSQAVSGPNGLGIVADAARVLDRLRPLHITDQFSFGLGICGIGGASVPRSFSRFWEHRHNHVQTAVGGDQVTLAAGDRVLWGLTSCPYDPETERSDCPNELELRAPSRAKAGKPFRVRVIEWTQQGKRSPAQGATVLGSAPTDAKGFTTLSLGSSRKLVAARADAISSQPLSICVRAVIAQCKGARGLLVVGSPRRDSAAGTRGNDVIKPGGGNDAVIARAGNDRIGVRGGGRDFVNCGAGFDVVRAGKLDRVADNCERVRRKGRV